jgi:hypothetical protein
MIEFMSGETFGQNLAAISLGLEILKDRSDSWRRARLLEIYDTRSDWVADVLSTQYGPVVVVSTAVDDSADRIQLDSKRGVLPLTDEPPDDRIVVTTRHGQYVLRAEELLAAIRDGRTKLVLGRITNE